MLDFPRWKILFILFTILICGASALPNFVPAEYRDQLPSFLPQDTINLGLDLRGGSHLLLEVDFDTYYIERLGNLRNDVRLVLRDDRIGYRGLSLQDEAVIFILREETIDADTDVAKILRGVDDGIEVTAEGNRYAVRYTEEQREVIKKQVLAQSIEIINRRINETGTKEPTIQQQGTDRILVQVPGLEDPEQLKVILGKTAKMTFHLVNESLSAQQLQSGIVPPGTRLLPSAKGDRFEDGTAVRYPIYAEVALSGEQLTGATATFQQGQPVVQFQFNTTGARKFGKITSENVGKRFAVVLDNQVITAPVIRSPILGGSGIIEGGFTVDGANELALLLRAGALPAPLDIIEERSVGPSLGADSIAAGKLAAIIAVVLVVVFMLITYGLFGLFSDIALIINMILVLGVLSMLQATLTLPGIAGIVLTLGMAVDANVLIFERIREESRNGKTPFAAVDHGFRSAFGTILDSNITTLIAAVILFTFGTGTIRGFAVTLSIGIISSMFSAILLTRLMVVVWLKSKRPKTLALS